VAILVAKLRSQLRKRYCPIFTVAPRVHMIPICSYPYGLKGIIFLTVYLNGIFRLDYGPVPSSLRLG